MNKRPPDHDTLKHFSKDSAFVRLLVVLIDRLPWKTIFSVGPVVWLWWLFGDDGRTAIVAALLSRLL